MADFTNEDIARALGWPDSPHGFAATVPDFLHSIHAAMHFVWPRLTDSEGWGLYLSRAGWRWYHPREDPAYWVDCETLGDVAREICEQFMHEQRRR